MTKTLRVTSSLWVAALVRRCNGEGAMTVVQRRGSEEAGAIFILIDRLDGTVDLYGPAAQSTFDDARPSDRKFQHIGERMAQADLDARLEREIRFDPDLWIVAIEDRTGRTFFEIEA